MNKTAVLIINTNETWCGACGVPADPEYQQVHEIKDYGCGARFVAVTSDEPELRTEIEKLRPDLPWTDREIAAAE
jgi:hypothetical protein